MERLTYKWKNSDCRANDILFENENDINGAYNIFDFDKDNENEVEVLYRIVETLADYEDTGLTPEIVMEYKKFEDELVLKHNIRFNEVLERIEKYPQLQKEDAELKELLKIMLQDLNGKCSACVVKDGDMRECFGCSKINSKWQWQHADYLKELGVE